MSASVTAGSAGGCFSAELWHTSGVSGSNKHLIQTGTDFGWAPGSDRRYLRFPDQIELYAAAAHPIPVYS